MKVKKKKEKRCRLIKNEISKASLVNGLKNMINEANNGDDYWYARLSSS